MKISTKSSNTVFLFVLLFAILTSASATFANQNKPFSSQKLNPEADEYLPGVITLKVKAGIGPFEPQRSNVSTGINSLDDLIQQFSVATLNKRFKHKPISKNSGLPALDRIYKVEFSEEVNVWKVAQAFAADPNIEYAEPVFIYHTSEVPNDPMYVQQQHLPQIMASEAWDVHKGEEGTEEVVVAIIDTGVDWLHPDLTENNWQNLGEDADLDGVTLEFNNGVWERDPDDLNGIDDDNNGFIDDVIGWDFHEDMTLGNGSNPDPIWGGDGYEHGSHCAGIAAGVTNNGLGISSVSFNITYMPVQVDNGNDQFPYAWDAIIYAAENGADIISNSWGGTAYSQTHEEIFEYANGLGSIVVAAAGNGNSSQHFYPSAYQGVISVAALNSDDTRASFSNYGNYIDISAPGVGILSSVTNSSYASWNGTSMATPMVAGLFGLLKSYHPEWTNEELINQVIGTADDIDELNPEYENALGDGRINAYHALVDENVIPQQELKLEFLYSSLDDYDGNGMIEPGESASFNLQMKNWSHLVSSDNVTLTLSTYDQDVTITTNSMTTSAPADGEFEASFEFMVIEGAPTKEVTFFVEVTADIDIVFGNEFQLTTLIAPSGIFVWDGEINEDDYSGAFISQYLQEQGYDFIYTDRFPSSFAGFDAVFLSFGSSPELTADDIGLLESHLAIMIEYLQEGGSLYVEGSPFFYLSEFYNFLNHDEFIGLFGVESGWGQLVQNPISLLSGLEGTINEGMTFNSSNQNLNWYIDKIVPDESGIVSFYEEDYGNVSVYNEGEFGQKTFYFSYILAELVDEDPQSSRYNFLTKVMDFFGCSDGDVVANFVVNETDVLPGEEIQFTDWSISNEGNLINSWAWDFDEDGIIDSEEQNPVWSYDVGGNWDVILVVSNGQSTDTLLRKDLVMVKSGIFVFEGEENGADQSGSFIRDHLVDNGYEVVYANRFPTDLIGFDAVFASFGSKYYSSPVLTDEMANTLKSFGQQGGHIYLEGSQALGFDQEGNNFLWFIFGLETVENGSTNSIDLLAGQTGTIMEGMEFGASSQFDNSNIDLYQPYEDASTAHIAFDESDYGAVAIQFDGTDFYGQKTFCMSYSLANLEDSNYPNTREELLNRVMEFFNPTTGTNDQKFVSKSNVQLYPNPASNQVTLAIDLDQKTSLEVELYDFMGRKVLDYPKNIYHTGRNEISMDISALMSGTYFYRIISTEDTYSRKLLIVK